MMDSNKSSENSSPENSEESAESSEIKQDNKEMQRMYIEYLKVKGEYRPNIDHFERNSLQSTYFRQTVVDKPNFDFDNDYEYMELKDEFTEGICLLTIPKLVVFKNEVVLFYLAPDKNNNGSSTLYSKSQLSDFTLVFKSVLRDNTAFTIPFNKVNKCIKEKENEFSIYYTARSSFNTSIASVTTKYSEDCDLFVNAINILKKY